MLIMNSNNLADPNMMNLFFFMGEAVCMIQILEAALSCSVVLKQHFGMTKQEADLVLVKQRGDTLGKIIKVAGKKNLLSNALISELNTFLSERNWLIHKAMLACPDDENYRIVIEDDILMRIKNIAANAKRLQHKIEMDLVDFGISRGKDMSKVISLIASDHARNIS